MTDAGTGPPLGPSRGAFLQPAYTALTLLPTASHSVTFNVLILAISAGICSTGPKRAGAQQDSDRPHRWERAHSGPLDPRCGLKRARQLAEGAVHPCTSCSILRYHETCLCGWTSGQGPRTTPEPITVRPRSNGLLHSEMKDAAKTRLLETINTLENVDSRRSVPSHFPMSVMSPLEHSIRWSLSMVPFLADPTFPLLDYTFPPGGFVYIWVPHRCTWY